MHTCIETLNIAHFRKLTKAVYLRLSVTDLNKSIWRPSANACCTQSKATVHKCIGRLFQEDSPIHGEGRWLQLKCICISSWWSGLQYSPQQEASNRKQCTGLYSATFAFPISDKKYSALPVLLGDSSNALYTYLMSWQASNVHLWNLGYQHTLLGMLKCIYDYDMARLHRTKSFLADDKIWYVTQTRSLRASVRCKTDISSDQQ